MPIFNKDIIALATKNTNFQQEVFYDDQCQIVLMHLEPGQDIGEETHDADQTTFVVAGEGHAKIDGKSTKITPNHVVVVPKGSSHNFINEGEGPMKIFTVYSPPAEDKGVSHKTKEEAEEAEED